MAFRMIVIGLIFTMATETCNFIFVLYKKYELRNYIYHFYDIIQAFLTTAYFIFALRPYHYRKLLIVSAVAWPTIGLLNLIYLQRVNELNTNMMLLESFIFITLSLNMIYHIFRTNTKENIFKDPNFQIAVCFLISWCTSFFFWGFLHSLYNSGWKYMTISLYLQAVIEIMVYLGIAATLFFNKKRQIMNEC